MINKIPKTFFIKGKEWNVEYKWRLHDPDHGHCNGLCDFNKRLILLDRLLPKAEKENTFLHELNHAILHEAHLHEAGGIDGFVEETVVSAIADAYLSLFDLKWKRKS